MDFKLIAQDIRYAKPTIWRTNKETLEATAKNQNFCVLFFIFNTKMWFSLQWKVGSPIYKTQTKLRTIARNTYKQNYCISKTKKEILSGKVTN